MTPFTKHTGRAAPLPLINIDTDMIIPKQFLKTIKRTGLGANLFDEMRFTKEGAEIAEFVLNQPAYRESSIIVAGDNFGCGSSREHAPWALMDFGIRCIIAPSYADIFFNNCFKNGILPITLSKDKVDEMTQAAANPDNEMTIDLDAQVIRCMNIEYRFDVDPFRKHCLMNGLDDIGLTLEKAEHIASYESKRAPKTPWLFKKAS